MSELEGKRVFVTGSGAGIGKAIAALCTERGARVVISDVNADAAKQAAGEIGAAGVANCDVTDEAQVQSAIQEAVGLLGGLDVLVNNAGIEVSSPLLQQPTESFDKIFAVNVRGTFVTMKAAIPHLVESKGNIVNIASIAGLGGSPLLGSYCATKAAVIQLTRVAAVEMRPAGVRVNAVCPGFADTAMVERLVPDFEAATQVPFGDLVAAKQGRLGTPRDIAEVTAFLASDRASWITGSHYVLDGGLTASLV
ncbi:short-chain dehydrogenase/reductase SDR [Amycolatopsis mediterranei S699]|jgi:NAD(P)-dependent dehydrogenase (short-subunit alcohol dehydrogenase family)|uniref:Short-chain dehydrogenase/reductase SDR n=2 Tax=Amycolatopsis mediterranei TaxID=33910 RepID=A0A0H3D4X0_AMYMU|nr:SDR family oxidoreductase [Amycolatopsis mediterranei]ADJ45282.1 short-chain dehydrogenase/reductase SDR [Amycolatopsis mediterranei U32]AEK42042.1 short-chain dehydrogenase/reductase SDR [Amycolatopsis mediterranei S699]AFO76993.1 short-chain dehydrogenase/reductase SDR [Amycolatopsis mediterranei S699]AGT84121.1 short-chain dehydrogenase/reductase SDR [Amycolatopsis mediterranei RB]KDO08567.1 short-chain dehydrogenase [Amycolatopsis mediterranei]